MKILGLLTRKLVCVNGDSTHFMLAYLLCQHLHHVSSILACLLQIVLPVVAAGLVLTIQYQHFLDHYYFALDSLLELVVLALLAP